MFKTFLQWLTNSKEEENEGIRVHLDFVLVMHILASSGKKTIL